MEEVYFYLQLWASYYDTNKINEDGSGGVAQKWLLEKVIFTSYNTRWEFL